jgi:hypothetical protein
LDRFAGRERVPLELVKETRDLGRLTVVNFAAGGVATPADAAMMMQLGCDGVFVGSVCRRDRIETKRKKKKRNAGINECGSRNSIVLSRSSFLFSTKVFSFFLLVGHEGHLQVG